MSLTARIEAFLEKPIMAGVFFLGGVVWDTLTLTRIDRLRDNLILLLYLLILGGLIVATTRAELGGSIPHAGSQDSVPWRERVRPYYRRIIQFLLGGQFSAYAVYYFKSASLTSTWVFFVLLVGLLVTNEF